MNKEKIINQIKRLQAEGYSFTGACHKVGVAKSTAWDWLNDKKHDSQHFNKSNTVSKPSVFVKNREFKKCEENYEDVMQFISSLAPIKFPTPIRPNVYQSPNNYAMVIGDTHFGMENWKVLDLFLEAVSIIKPSTIVLNGDTLDMFAISRYPKDVRHTYSLEHERIQYHKFLKLLHDITEPYQSKILETNANHSGDGVEGRWWRYLSESIGQIIDIPGVRESLSYENVFFPKDDWNRTELVDFVELCGKDPDNHFVIMHGDVVRRHGGYSARGVLEKWYTSAMINHTHRIGMTPQTFPSIGSKRERVIRVYENGCACSLKPDYASAANWQNAFSIINYDDNNYSVETVVVNRNSAAISTIGKTLRV